jgi:hypothetical protein
MVPAITGTNSRGNEGYFTETMGGGTELWLDNINGNPNDLYL